ncbi:MAG: hypothetical protein JNM17_07030 [Archangium sp.]|nr:hypothetical protein [Archangium sp.]
MRRLLLPALCFLSLFGCDDPFEVNAKAASVCQHLENQRFPIPADVRAQLMQLPPEMRRGFEVSRAFDFDVSAQLPSELKELMKSNVKLTSVKISAAEGAPDLGFIDEAHVTLQPQAGSGLESRQFDYVKSEAAPRSITWAGDAFDVTAYVESGNLRYLVSFVGDVPEGDVVVTIDACAEASVKLDYLDL